MASMVNVRAKIEAAMKEAQAELEAMIDTTADTNVMKSAFANLDAIAEMRAVARRSWTTKHEFARVDARDE